MKISSIYSLIGRNAVTKHVSKNNNLFWLSCLSLSYSSICVPCDPVIPAKLHTCGLLSNHWRSIAFCPLRKPCTAVLVYKNRVCWECLIQDLRDQLGLFRYRISSTLRINISYLFGVLARNWNVKFFDFRYLGTMGHKCPFFDWVFENLYLETVLEEIRYLSMSTCYLHYLVEASVGNVYLYSVFYSISLSLWFFLKQKRNLLFLKKISCQYWSKNRSKFKFNICHILQNPIAIFVTSTCNKMNPSWVELFWQ